MNRLALIPSLGALLALPGCIVTHGLGETAEDTSDGSAEGSGTGADGETEPDPSATSGQPGTTDAATGETGQVPETSDGPATETDGETDGEPGCELDPEYLRWNPSFELSGPLEGVDATFAAILRGSCTVGDVSVIVPEDGDPIARVPLQCAVEGRIDGDPEFAGELSPVLELNGTIDFEEVAQVLGEDVRLKLVLDWWGMGWNGWIVLEHPNTGEALLDLVAGEYLDPYASSLGQQVGEVFGGPWRPTLAVGEVEDECGAAVGSCNEEPRAVNVGFGPNTLLRLHEWQEGTLSDEDLFLLYRASVTAARAIPEATCTDTPLGHYVFAAWALPQ